MKLEITEIPWLLVGGAYNRSGKTEDFGVKSSLSLFRIELSIKLSAKRPPIPKWNIKFGHFEPVSLHRLACSGGLASG